MVDVYRDATKSVGARVKDLISRMTLDEKIVQIGGVWTYELITDGKFSEANAESVLKDGIGHICLPGESTALPPKEMAELINGIQKFLAEKTRLGIPALFHEECLNGFMAKKAAVFPQIIGMASTWEPELVTRMARVARENMLAVGVRQGLSPVLDIARDPRWGRIEETFGEDPHLITAMGIAYVQGLQGDDIKNAVVATLKHFVGYGLSEGGLNWAPANIPARLLHDVYLYPFQEVIKQAKPMSVMNAYQEIDGIPCAASAELLTDILRKKWGFQGLVVSDYFAVDNLQSYHHVAADKAGAARLALTAGIDSELPKLDCYAQPLKEQIEKGEVSEQLLDRAVARILRLKFMLGTFENRYVNAGKAANSYDLPAHRQLALESARKSIVLLKNEGALLPLSKNNGTIAVIGPNADSRRNLLGDYTYPAHLEVMMKMAEDMGMEVSLPDEPPDHVTTHVITVLEGIKTVAKNTKILYAVGCEYNSPSRDGFPEAIKAAKAADVAIVVVGGRSGLVPNCTSGEMRDRVELGLPGVQEDLVRAIYETGTPVILVLVDGRPLALDWMAEKIAAILEAWLPGEEGGKAVAEVIFGDYNPGGKLPVTFPRKPGQIPVYYAHKPSGSRSQLWGDYVDCSTSPAFDFGYGLSYTTFKLSNLKIAPKRVSHDGKVSLKVDIQNTGDRSGEEVVQLYVNDIVASVTRPVKELKGFKRIGLKPAETKTVEFELSVNKLGFYDRDFKYTVEPGIFKIMIGTSSRDIALEDRFEVID
jgi:beta-glucosidase